MMRIQVLQISFLFGLYIIRSVNGESHDTIIEPRDFDYIIFAQRWAPTFCINREQSAQLSKYCGESNVKDWSIHGIWPADIEGMGPNFCNSSVNFDPTNLEKLKNELDNKWSSVLKGSNEDFWSYEWKKHGTCGVFLETIDTQFEYFEQALKLFDTYNIKRMLVEANILPGGEYSVQDIINALERSLKKKVIVTCKKNKETKVSYLFEILICLNKTFQPIDCIIGISQSAKFCDKSKNVMYPTTPLKSGADSTICGAAKIAILVLLKFFNFL